MFIFCCCLVFPTHITTRYFPTFITFFPIVPSQTMDEVPTVYIKQETFKHTVPLNLFVYLLSLFFFFWGGMITVIALHCVWGHKFKELYNKHPTPTLGQFYPS